MPVTGSPEPDTEAGPDSDAPYNFAHPHAVPSPVVSEPRAARGPVPAVDGAVEDDPVVPMVVFEGRGLGWWVAGVGGAPFGDFAL
jgi:hypothetical protein